jgi:hypothetical protein
VTDVERKRLATLELIIEEMGRALFHLISPSDKRRLHELWERLQKLKEDGG